jgi:hypothetical protein
MVRLAWIIQAMKPSKAAAKSIILHSPVVGIVGGGSVVETGGGTTAVTVVPPPQVVLAVGAITTPLGKVSVSAAVRVTTLVMGLLKVMVRVETPPGLMVARLKALLRARHSYGEFYPEGPPTRQ